MKCCENCYFYREYQEKFLLLNEYVCTYHFEEAYITHPDTQRCDSHKPIKIMERERKLNSLLKLS